MAVTIRRILLLTFLALGLAPTVLASALAFLSMRATMQDDIRRELRQQAGAVTASVDNLLFERLQNASTWSRLDVMQDVQVGDVDKRISIFLTRLQEGYGGIYKDLLVADSSGRLVASSEPKETRNALPAYREWKHLERDGLDISLTYPTQSADGKTLALIVPLLSLVDQRPVGKLMLELDWGRFESMLDHEEYESRMVAIVDDAHELFAASHGLRSSADSSSLGPLFPEITLGSGLTVSTYVPQSTLQALVSTGELFSERGTIQSGLHAIVVQSEDIAFRPVRNLARTFFVIWVLLSAAIILVANRVSNTFARPILALTEFSRAYRLGQPLIFATPSTGGEIAELRAAFQKMVEDVEVARRKLIRSAKLAAVGEMAAAIVHEIRTPLGIMRSSAQVLKREPQLTAEARELVAFVESETERLNRLVSTLLENARPKLPLFVDTDFHELLHRLAAILKPQLSEKNISLHEIYQATDARVACDHEQIGQVVLNLLQNAIAAVTPMGNITITTSDAGEAFQLSINDDGSGILDEDKPRVFEVFFSKREGGIGLGLAISQQIVAAHGGDISVANSPEGGASFILILPRVPQLPAKETE